MKISTSILNSDNRIETIKKLNNTNTSFIHIDVMDGKFVNNIQFNNIEEIEKIDVISKHPLDIHLMVKKPIEYIERFNNLDIEYITIHLEINEDIKPIIELIKSHGYKVGISIKPSTSIEELLPYMSDIDLVLIMSVEPGHGGQRFIPKTTEKAEQLFNIIKEKQYKVKIEIDGGINEKTISLLDNIDIAVVGSYIIHSNNYNKSIDELIKITNR